MHRVGTESDKGKKSPLEVLQGIGKIVCQYFESVLKNHN